MLMSDLDSIIEKSLRSLYEDICSLEWCGRENEMVNLYALGHLAKHCVPGTILSELTQIGIEVAVRQLSPDKEHPKKKKDVRKDLVIWPDPRMNLWKSNCPVNEPLAVIEWKVNHYLNRAVHQQNRREHLEDVNWLRQTSSRLGDANFVGYSVLVENTRNPKELTCIRLCRGKSDEKPWIMIPTATLGPSHMVGSS
jgi:hypothetical protein